MVVVVAKHIPPAVRGRMKLWFIEARANVFVSGIKDAVADKVVEYLFSHCPASSGLMVFTALTRAPWYTVRSLGEPYRRVVRVSGFPLIEEENIGKSE